MQAYSAFLKRLPAGKPKELVLINPQLVPEEAFDPLVARNLLY